MNKKHAVEDVEEMLRFWYRPAITSDSSHMMTPISIQSFEADQDAFPFK